MTVGADVVAEAERRGVVEPAVLATRVSSTWLAQNAATREQVTAAIDRAIGGRVVRLHERTPVTLVINDNRHQLNMGAGAQIADSQVNVSGTQINVRAEAPKEDVMAAVAALVRAGLNDDWNPNAARALAEVV
jgi:ribosome-associated translation inhibitor RaiA